MAEVHPVQNHRPLTHVPQAVTMRAYEVYCHCFGKQEAMVTGGCRGGFGIGELIAFLYAYPFPKDQWHARIDEALAGMSKE